ncbi:hypothetical protein [Chryseobacterium wangxinyae]|uniref:hypothetical protein n=1 Tax=Chryseobacterium sp. CY353 TaxID=2997334 RepID=UPI00226DEB4E|nr:hypothetical protein [Chryseobacterium sp. CY353]MCY0970727.1 hypothetical protein [Chryseobacterium sp. CY353]
MDYKTCKITPGKVGLSELAEHFGLQPEELRWFHNRFCPIKDLIDPDIQSHVEVVYVPFPGLETGYFASTKKKKPLYQKTNCLNVPRVFKKNYGIIQTVQENEGEKLTIHYETELKKIDKNQIFISRKPIYINQKRPDMVMEQIADEVGSVFYPLQLELYENAKLKRIANFPEIQKRWKIKKQQLASYYKGEIAEKLLNRIDKQLDYRGKTQRGILDSLFFTLYFFPLYELFSDNKTHTFQVSLPIFPKVPRVLFEITLRIDEEISETQKFVIMAKGKCIDPRTETEIANGKEMHNPINKGEMAEGNLDFTYRLNAKDNSIYSIWGQLELKIASKAKKISFECYEQQ